MPKPLTRARRPPGLSGIYMRNPLWEAAYARAQAAGATITRPIQNTGYGSREFAVEDPEGHSWSAGTYDPWQPHS